MEVRILRCAFVVVIVGAAVSCLQAQSPPPRSPDEAHLGLPISGTQVTVIVPRSRDCVLAYSNMTGQWSKQPIEPPTKPFFPVVGDDVAAFQIGNIVFAFSAECGRWASVLLPTNASESFSVGSNFVNVMTKDTYYIFCPKTGTWSSVNLDTGAITPQEESHDK